MHVAGMRQATPDKPEFLIEANGVDDERLALPVADGVTEITGIQLLFRRMFSAGLHGDPAPVPVLPIDDEDPTELRLIDELHPIRNRKESHPTRRLTPRVRIVQPTSRSAVVVKSSGPVLEGHLIECEIARQTAWSDRAAAGDVPESFDAWHLAQVHSSVRPMRSRLGRRGRLSRTSRASAFSRTPPTLFTGCRLSTASTTSASPFALSP